MNIQKLIESMDRFQHILPVLIDGVTDEDVRWRPESDNWSILEIVCHLVDEEKEDFRPRVQSTLQDPTRQWTPWDPEGTALARGYCEQDVQVELNEFLAERKKSLTFLGSLDDPDWSLAYQHPTRGPMTAGMIMSGWAAHDQLHIRQVAKRLFEMNQRDGAHTRQNTAVTG